MNGPMRRLAMALLGAFAVLLFAASWVQVLDSDTYRSNPLNPRTNLSLSLKERGLIVAADGTVLARSDPRPDEPQAFDRMYPEGEAYAHVVGYTSLLVGDAGLEDAYRDDLRSRRDLTISDLIAALFGRDLRPLNLQLSIDPALQTIALDALGDQRGAVVALDPATGAILAYVSTPSYDPQQLTGPDAVANRTALLEDADGPLRDRVTQELYAPGSTFKTVVAASAIEAGLAGQETEFPDVAVFPLPGSSATISNASGRPCTDGDLVTLQTAFVRSCNTVFAELAIEVGAETLGSTAEGLGFNQTIEFPWSIAPSAFETGELSDDPAALGQSGIGQRDVRATPLVMAMVAGAIANGGDVMQPTLVEQVFDADGEVVETTTPQVLFQPLSPSTASVMTEMMERVVTEGTGRQASVSGVRVAGKTGTAEEPGLPPDLWFIGFAPVESPSIAVAVMVEEGGGFGESASGGNVAAPIAARLIDSWVNR